MNKVLKLNFCLSFPHQSTAMLSCWPFSAWIDCWSATDQQSSSTALVGCCGTPKSPHSTHPYVQRNWRFQIFSPMVRFSIVASMLLSDRRPYKKKWNDKLNELSARAIVHIARIFKFELFSVPSSKCNMYTHTHISEWMNSACAMSCDDTEIPSFKFAWPNSQHRARWPFDSHEKLASPVWLSNIFRFPRSSFAAAYSYFNHQRKRSNGSDDRRS